MLSQLLIAYTDDFDTYLSERLGAQIVNPPPSLAMWANVLRFVGKKGVASQQLPRLSGIAKATIKSMLGCLVRHGWITIDAEGAVHLTKRGAAAQSLYGDAHDAVLSRWDVALGAEALQRLRNALETASDRLGRELPQYPMPAPHRGAYPTGK